MSNLCPRCRATNDSASQICHSCGALLRPRPETRVHPSAPIPLTVDEYAVSPDLIAARAIQAIPGLTTAVEWLDDLWSRPMKRAELLGNGLRLGPTQVPSLHRILEDCARRLTVPVPEIFIRQDPTLNAMTFGTNDNHVIVLHSALVDLCQPEELAFIIGHELGHIKSRHVTYLNIARMMTNGAGLFVGALLLPFRSALAAWSREAELTADRAGLLSMLDAEAAIRAMLLLVTGSRRLFPEIDLRQYLAQEAELDNFYGLAARWFADHPENVTRLRQLLTFATSPAGQQLQQRLARRHPPSRLPSPAAASAAAPPPALPAVPNGRFCRSCGFELEGSRVCAVCGTTH